MKLPAIAKKIVPILLFFSLGNIYAQQKATVYGTIKDNNKKPVEAVTVAVVGKAGGTYTDKSGKFSLEVDPGEEITLAISHIAYKSSEIKLNLAPGEQREVNFEIEPSTAVIPQITIEEESTRFKPLTRIDPKTITALPSAAGGVEALLKTLPGVSSNNELTSQYSVRGGNYDENLVYVNDIEIYRPLLIRAGQQEGLSFINSDMVSSILFSAGGFDAKYGDKMSSVLDIQYRKAREFGGTASIGALGASLHLEGASKDYRLTSQFGIRQKSNQYLLNSLETKGEYKPSFTDVQSFFTYDLTEKWELNFLGNISRNQYRVVPKTRETSFGTINDALRLKVFFDGQEDDRFDTYMSAFSAINRPSNHLTLKFITSAFRSMESEAIDIQGQYWLDELERDISSDDFGKVKFNRGVGTFHNHARNELKALVFNTEHKGYFNVKNNYVQWGAKYQHELISDKLKEWKMVDSADYALPQHPPDVILMQDVIRTKIRLESNRYTSYIQNTKEFGDSARYSLTAGLRANYWDLNKQLVVSPRATISVKPNWKRDIILRASSGFYFQPPFYRELRDFNGIIHRDVKAQRSIHFVLGSDLNFTAWQRPFKFVSELYYKQLNSLIPYEYDNVRTRYYAENNAKGYATGIDLKINGEFVEGVESWFSLSVMQTREDILNDNDIYFINSDGERIIRGYTFNDVPVDTVSIAPGYIPRPTDQRVNFSIFFQDYLPRLPDFKMHLGLYYGSGLPFGPPDNTRFKDTLRMPSYKRVDIGFSYLIIGERKQAGENSPFRHLKSLWISAEVLNLLEIDNTLSYLWIKDVTNRTYAIPNYLTSRLLNVRLVGKF